MATFFLIAGVLLVCGLISILCRIWLIALGFQRHWGWGCALLFQLLLMLGYFGAPETIRSGFLPSVGTVVALSQIIALVFIVVAWNEAKQPFFWLIASTCVAFLVLFGALFYAADSSTQIKAVLEQRGFSPALLDRVTGWRPTPPDPAGQRMAGPKRNPSGAQQDPGTPATPAVFRSRLPPRQLPPGEREAVRPGIYYLRELVTTKTPRGVKNGLPGEAVTLLQRLPNGKMLVTVGNADFVVEAAQLTDDLDVARDVEKRYFDAHNGQL